MRIKGSYLLSLLIALIVFGWMFSDDFFPGYANDENSVANTEASDINKVDNGFGLTVDGIAEAREI